MLKQQVISNDKSVTTLIPAIKLDQLDQVIKKIWGHEEWIINNEKYCGKKLVFNAGYQCSMHHHKIKDETFYIQSGTVILETERDGKKETRLMTPGDTARIIPLVWHQLTALTNAQVFEFSTFHMEEDSYRKTTSGKVDLSKFNYV